MSTNPPATPSRKTKAPTPRERLLAAAAHLDSFASVVPLVFNQAEGRRLVCVNQAGHQWHGPEPHEALKRFYKAIEEIDQTLKQLGCEGPEGQPLLPGYVMVWAQWMWLNPARPWPDHARHALTLGKSLERWWATCRTQTDATSKHPWCWSVDAGAAEFARVAAVEARLIAASIFGAKGATPAAPSSRTPEQIRSNTPPLDKESSRWVSLKRLQGLLNLKASTLGDHRRDGWTDDDQMLGCDIRGRVWRREGTTKTHPWYFVPTVPEISTKSVDKNSGSAGATP